MEALKKALKKALLHQAFNPNAAIEGGRFARRSRCDGCL
jgi:hypothetical protein